MEKHGGISFCNTCPILFNWIVEFLCLNILPALPMSQYYARMLPKARNKVNGGRKGNGTTGYFKCAFNV